MRVVSAGITTLSLLVVAALVPASPAQGQTASDPTFTRDVLPLLQRSCQQCHRAGTGAPMSLLTYEETRPWARSIRDAA